MNPQQISNILSLSKDDKQFTTSYGKSTKLSFLSPLIERNNSYRQKSLFYNEKSISNQNCKGLLNKTAKFTNFKVLNENFYDEQAVSLFRKKLKN